MPKTTIRIILGVIMMLGLVVSASACTAKSEPGYAGSITEGILIGINESDYVNFSEHFDEAMQNAIPEADFEQLVAVIKATVGDYVLESKEFWKVITSDIYTDVFYKAEFTKEAEVVVHVSFHESEGEIYVNGLWFDSPKLRGE